MEDASFRLCSITNNWNVRRIATKLRTDFLHKKNQPVSRNSINMWLWIYWRA